MKTTLVIIGLILIASCSNGSNGSIKRSATSKDRTEPQSEFKEYFQNIDTTTTGVSIGCVSGFYKMLDENYVIRIFPNLNFEYGEIRKFEVNGFSPNVDLELLEFEKGEANLINVCTDVIMVNAPQYIRKYSSFDGIVTIGKSDPTDYYGNSMPRISIHLDQVVFYDSLGNEKLTIEDELFWKVLHLGTPG